LIFFDFSEVGPWEPTTDLAQTIISDVKPELFVKHTKTLVRKYWDRLIELGVPEKSYPFTNCWESFCRGGPERWIFLLGFLICYPGIPINGAQYFHDQLLAFIESHGDLPFYQIRPIICLI